eukprot:3559172-Pyramimonas_sp.AAC.1
MAQKVRRSSLGVVRKWRMRLRCVHILHAYYAYYDVTVNNNVCTSFSLANPPEVAAGHSQGTAERSIRIAAQAIKEADYLLVATGAGFSQVH